MSTQGKESEGGSIYEKFKQNTQKIFNEDSFKEGLDKGYQMLHERQISKNSNRRHDNKVILRLFPFLQHTSYPFLSD